MAEPAPQIGGSPGRRAFLSAVVVAIIGFQLALIVRTHLQDDDRYGFAMFHQFIKYELDYQWIIPGGNNVSFTVGDELQGYGAKFNGKRRRTSVMGVGATRSYVLGVTRYLGEDLPEGAVAVETLFSYQIDGRGKKIKEVYRWPPEAGAP